MRNDAGLGDSFVHYLTATTVSVDFGYRGVDQQNPGIQINHRGKAKRLNENEPTLLERRQSVRVDLNASGGGFGSVAACR